MIATIKIIINTLNILFPGLFIITYYFIIILAVLLLYWLVLCSLWEIQFKFSQLIFTCNTKRFYNPEVKQHINVSLMYKIYFVPLTMCKIFLYFILVILSVFSIRILRLGQIIDIVYFYNKISYFAIYSKVIIVVIVCLYLYILKTYLQTFSGLLYFELKKIYIYSLTIGGLYDIENYRTGYNKSSYMKRICSYLTCGIAHLRTVFGRVSANAEYDDTFSIYECSTYEYLTKIRKMPHFWIFLYYLLNDSKYKNSFIIEKMKMLMKSLHAFLLDYFWMLCKLLPVILLVITALYELFYKEGLLGNIYYILLFVFVYKIYIDFSYFFEERTNISYNELLCIYYYVIDNMHLKVNKESAIDILSHYKVYTKFDNERKLFIFLKTHLDFDKVLIDIKEHQGEKYKEQHGFLLVLREKVDKFFEHSKLFNVITKSLETLISFLYDNNDLKSDKKNLNYCLNNMNFSYRIFYSNWMLFFMILLCWKYLFFVPIYYTMVISMPLSLIIVFITTTNLYNKKQLMFPKIVLLSYLILILILYFCYVKHYHIINMNEVFWDLGVRITQSFSVEEKLTFFHKYLRYFIYCKTNMNAFEKREFLALIDFNHVRLLIDDQTTLSKLKDLVSNIIDLYYKQKDVVPRLIKNIYLLEETTILIDYHLAYLQETIQITADEAHVLRQKLLVLLEKNEIKFPDDIQKHIIRLLKEHEQSTWYRLVDIIKTLWCGKRR